MHCPCQHWVLGAEISFYITKCLNSFAQDWILYKTHWAHTLLTATTFLIKINVCKMTCMIQKICSECFWKILAWMYGPGPYGLGPLGLNGLGPFIIWKNVCYMLLEQYAFHIWSWSILNLEYSSRLWMVQEHKVLMVRDHYKSWTTSPGQNCKKVFWTCMYPPAPSPPSSVGVHMSHIFVFIHKYYRCQHWFWGAGSILQSVPTVLHKIF